MIALALLCRNAHKLTRMKTTDWEVINGDLQESTPSTWKTGLWAMNHNKAMTLIGENLILVESKADPSYIGGVITGFTLVEDNRVEITFEENPELTGRTEHTHLWRGSNPVCYLKGDLRCD